MCKVQVEITVILSLRGFHNPGKSCYNVSGIMRNGTVTIPTNVLFNRVINLKIVHKRI